MLRIGKGSVLILVMALVASACGGAAAPSPTPTVAATPTSISSAAAVGWTAKSLGEGSVNALPTTTLYINYVDVPQEPLASLQHAHIAGFVYAAVGVHRFITQGGPTVDLQPGEGAFVGQDLLHTHTNPGAAPNQWYFIAIRPIGGRTAAPTFPGQSVLYETPDLPTLPAGKYNERLDLITLEKGGRTPAHRHGGVEALVVLDGTLQVRVAGQQATMLTKGKGAYVLPNTVMQAINTGEGATRFLAFYVTADTAQFTTLVDTAP